MNTHTSRSVPTALPPWDAPDWYRALTLPERVAARAGCSGRFFTPDAELLQKAQRRLYAWKQQTPFDSHAYFAQRLAMDGIAEEELLELLAESDEVLQARLADAPEWLVILGLAYARAASGLSIEPDLLADLSPTSDRNGPLALLQPFRPLLQWGIACLQAGIQQSSQQWNCPPFAVQSLHALFAAYLPDLLLPKVDRALVLEMHVAKLRGQLLGETPQERFACYIERLNDPDVLRVLLEEYCVLARQLVVSIERWVDVSLELAQRLAADWPIIRTTFAPRSDPGSLIKVSAGAGDLHRGGRSVTILEFASGLKLVYKPKSLAIDQHFQELLAWLNARGQQPPLRLLKLLDRGAYGWVEFIEPAPCYVREEVERFYERQGSYLALLYALEAVDMHYENVMAAGEHPMFVDLEALFHPHLVLLNSPLSEHPAHRALSSSVLHIGMLPLRLWAKDEFAGIDVSGLGGEAGQVSPYTVPSWENAGTDEMQLTRRHVLSGSQQNRPTLNGHEVQVLDYCEQFIQGFTSTYQLLIAHREDLCREFLPRFAQDEVRCLPRNTKVYKWLLFESFHPNVLRDALQRERTFDRLWLVVNDRPYLTRLIAAERADLQQGDIPLFTTIPESRDLCTSRGQRITDFFAESSLDIVRQRLEGLSGEDLARQSWLIQAAFTSFSAADRPKTARKMILQPSERPVTYERLIQAAVAVGDHLCKLAVQRGDALGWFEVTETKEYGWELQPADTSLYHGNAGIALFLAYLGHVTGEHRYTAAARSAGIALRYDLAWQQAQPRPVEIGGFLGLGSVVYLFSHLGKLWHEPGLFEEAMSVIELLTERIKNDTKFDILSGSAGAILSLLSLYTVFPSERVLQAALRCGEHLLVHAQPLEQGIGWQTVPQYWPLAGFSHGAAGIAYSMLRLAALSGETRFRRAALAAFAYERSLFSTAQQNWPVLAREEVPQPGFRMSWRYGAPGLGLGRIASLQFIDEPAIRQEISAALQTTISLGFGYDHYVYGPNHSLGSGDFGNLETLLVAAQVLQAPGYQETLERITAMLLESIDAYGWVTGTPLNVETPGLMNGLAGIGYQLLRLAEPGDVPSVLLLAAPRFDQPRQVRA